MTCAEVRAYIFCFLDGALDAPISLKVQRHLDHCARCAREAEIEKAVWKRLTRALDEDSTIPAFEENIHRYSLVSDAQRQTGGRRFQRLGAVLAAGLLLAAAVGLWYGARGTVGASQSIGFARLVAADFDHYIDEGLAVEHASSDPSSVRSWLREKTQIDVALADPPRDGYRLIGARKCKIQDEPAAFSAYSIEGVPASLVVVRGERFDLAGMRRVDDGERAHWVGRIDAHTVVACRRGPLLYAVVSDAPEAALLPLMPDSMNH